MKIQGKDFYHGVALTQIVEHPSFKALNKADTKYGHYQINHDTRILLKYRTKIKSPWSFQIDKEDVNTLIEDIASNQKSFLCLVCGKNSVCVLSSFDYQELIDTSKTDVQNIIIEISHGSRMHLRSKVGKLKHTIAKNSFPNALF